MDEISQIAASLSERLLKVETAQAHQANQIFDIVRALHQITTILNLTRREHLP